MEQGTATRRRFLTLSGAVAVTGTAGCTGNGDQSPSDNTTDDNDTDGGPNVGDDEDNDNGENGEDLQLETSFLSREEYAQPGDLFDDFEDESLWTAQSGEMDFDDETAYEGSQSMHLSAEDGENIVVERSVEDVDMTDRDISFQMYTPTPRNFAIYIEFEDIYGSTVNHQLRDITYRQNAVDWFRTCPGVFNIDVIAPEMDELGRMRLVVLNNSGTDVWIDDMRTHEKPDKGYVVLSWDDGFVEFYEDAAPIHEEFDYPAVQAAIPGYTGDAYMSVDQMLERQDEGDEIVMHGTHDPIHELEREDMEQRLENDKQWFINAGLEGGEYIIYPHNSFNATSLELKNHYHYAGGCNQSGDVNTTGVHGFDPLVLPRTIGGDLDTCKRAVDMAAAGRNCTILNFHRWQNDNTVSEEEYGELLEYIAEKGDEIEVITLDDLWKLRMDGH